MRRRSFVRYGNRMWRLACVRCGWALLERGEREEWVPLAGLWY